MARLRRNKPAGAAYELGNEVVEPSGGSRGLQAPECRLAITVASATGSLRESSGKMIGFAVEIVEQSVKRLPVGVVVLPVAEVWDKKLTDLTG